MIVSLESSASLKESLTSGEIDSMKATGYILKEINNASINTVKSDAEILYFPATVLVDSSQDSKVVQFTQANLVNGVLTISNNLGTDVLDVTVINSNNEIVGIETQVTLASIRLTFPDVITGAWKVLIESR